MNDDGDYGEMDEFIYWVTHRPARSTGTARAGAADGLAGQTLYFLGRQSTASTAGV